MTDPLTEAVARIIANAMGDNFADAFKNKARWIAKRGRSGGRFRDVNEPMQDDYLSAAQAAIAAMREQLVPQWQPIETAPRGLPTEDVGCRGASEWFLGKPSGKYNQSAPFIVICRRAWPQDDSWEDAGETYYRPDYFSHWMPLPAAPTEGEG